MATSSAVSYSSRMLMEFYIEALLVDENLADQVWTAWDTGQTDDATALFAWLQICLSPTTQSTTILISDNEE